SPCGGTIFTIDVERNLNSLIGKVVSPLRPPAFLDTFNGRGKVGRKTVLFCSNEAFCHKS
ncbi:MAG: hypothetical protein JXR13_12630, partial [Thalassovita sp.]